MDGPGESEMPKDQPKSTAGTPADVAGTAEYTATDADSTGAPVFSAQSGRTSDSAPTAEFVPTDGLAGDDGSVEPGTRIRYSAREDAPS